MKRDQRKIVFGVLIFSLVVVLSLIFVSTSVLAGEFDLQSSPDYIPCLDESYGFMPSSYSYPEYYDRNYIGHNAVVLHRKHVSCADDSYYELAMKGLEEQYLVLHGEKRDYCNYICRDRYEEQCIKDGSFDTYYKEWCEDAEGNVIEIVGSTYWEPVGYNCYSDRDCPIDSVCNSGYCSGDGNSSLECTSSFDCSVDEVCDAGKCVISTGQECVYTSDCNSGLIPSKACVNGHCIGLDCGYDEQCSEGEICFEGSCIAGNETNVTVVDPEEPPIEIIDKPLKKVEKIETPQVDEQAAESTIEVILEGCKDSDGGLNYYIQGTVEGSSGEEFKDYCLVTPENFLVEYFCGNNEGRDVIVTERHLCLDDCEKGTCIKAENECRGCFVEEKCFSIGVRNSGKFCNLEANFVVQLDRGNVCENNFECNSNFCLDSQCVSKGLVRKILDFFRGFF